MRARSSWPFTVFAYSLCFYEIQELCNSKEFLEFIPSDAYKKSRLELRLVRIVDEFSDEFKLYDECLEKSISYANSTKKGFLQFYKQTLGCLQLYIFAHNFTYESAELYRLLPFGFLTPGQQSGEINPFIIGGYAYSNSSDSDSSDSNNSDNNSGRENNGLSEFTLKLLNSSPTNLLELEENNFTIDKFKKQVLEKENLLMGDLINNPDSKLNPKLKGSSIIERFFL